MAAKAKTKTSKTKSLIPAADGKKLVIVESPAKARTVGQILGRQYVVVASLGHVRDLPKGKLGVDVDNEFEPSYVVSRDKMKLMNALKKAFGQASEIYLATDPDREGEAISWHLQQASGIEESDDKFKRVVFHEITKQAVEEAFEHPRSIDMGLVDAQQTRRILDRLVGFQLSPLLWRKVQRGLSAGRVQSVCLRMLTDRQKEIDSFTPVEYWSIELDMYDHSNSSATHIMKAVLHNLKGNRGTIEITDEDSANQIKESLSQSNFRITSITSRQRNARPSAPFTTSTLQQEAGRKLRFTTQRTMSVAQRLYEGFNVGGESVGLITYMRTDSVQVSDIAVNEARSHVKNVYGDSYIPSSPRMYKSRSKNAQEAHEAIRPTSIKRTPQSLSAYLDPDQMKLYTLIWSRMVASQMSDSVTESTRVEIDAVSTTTYELRSNGSKLIFDGFKKLYEESADSEDDNKDSKLLPNLSENMILGCKEITPIQHHTQAPPMYTEASLVKEMEEKGIGRPSTYAPTINTILDRNYVEREQSRLKPTVLGMTVSDELIDYFGTTKLQPKEDSLEYVGTHNVEDGTKILELDFTAEMENHLDDIASNEKAWIDVLEQFYQPFIRSLDHAAENMQSRKIEEPTDEVCEKCERPMVIKTGRFGRFIACTGFPDCKNAKPIVESTGVSCPECEDGDLIVKKARTRKGKSRNSNRPFYGCSRYPACEFLLNKKPVTDPCPDSNCKGGLMVIDKPGILSCTKCAVKMQSTPAVTSG
jgi:DNA topoisomerase-1